MGNRNRKLKADYQRLKITEYTNVIKDTLIPILDAFDGEYITTLTPETVFEIRKHYYEGRFYGWNIYADGALLETKSTRKKAERYLKKVTKNK